MTIWSKVKNIPRRFKSQNSTQLQCRQSSLLQIKLRRSRKKLRLKCSSNNSNSSLPLLSNQFRFKYLCSKCSLNSSGNLTRTSPRHFSTRLSRLVNLKSTHSSCLLAALGFRWTALIKSRRKLCLSISRVKVPQKHQRSTKNKETTL